MGCDVEWRDLCVVIYFKIVFGSEFGCNCDWYWFECCFGLLRVGCEIFGVSDRFRNCFSRRFDWSYFWLWCLCDDLWCVEMFSDEVF